MSEPALDPAVLAQITPTAAGFVGLDPRSGTSQSFHATVGSLTIEGSLDTASKDSSYDLYVQLPLLGRIKLASAQGNLAGGAAASFNIANLGTGTTSLYLKSENQIWFKYDSILLNLANQGDFPLFSV